MNERKELGKIKSIRIGRGGYQDAMLGIGFDLGGEGWGVSTPWFGCWETWSEDCKWTKQDQTQQFADAIRKLGELLSEAKVDEAYMLVGIPVEITFESNTLKSWRILKEVL